MKCRDIEKRLAEGRPLRAEEYAHLGECEGCRSMIESLNAQGDPVPEAAVRSIVAELLVPLNPAKPLRSDPTLILLTMSVFLVFSLAIALAVGMQGFVHLTLGERTLYYATILFFSLLFSIGAVQVAIPGSKVRISRAYVMAGSVLGIALIVTALFRTFALDHFVRQGIPCLRLGCICAVLFGALAAIFLRRGYMTDITAGAVLMGCFAGFSGVAVLSLHCPLQNAAHIIVWHLGTMAVSALGGLTVGSIIHRS